MHLCALGMLCTLLARRLTFARSTAPQVVPWWRVVYAGRRTLQDALQKGRGELQVHCAGGAAYEGLCSVGRRTRASHRGTVGNLTQIPSTAKLS